MIEDPKNSTTCGAGRDDIWGTSHPRDIHLQIGISLTLGVGAFVTFCVQSVDLAEKYSVTNPDF